MSSRTALALGAVAAVLAWCTAGWFVPVPWPALAVAYATVLGGRRAGTLCAAVAGLLVGAPSGTVGPWMLALIAAVLPVDRLHRETLTHRTPAAPVLLATVSVVVSLGVHWGALLLLAQLAAGTPLPGSAPQLLRATLHTVLAAAVSVALSRTLRTLTRRWSRVR